MTKASLATRCFRLLVSTSFLLTILKAQVESADCPSVQSVYTDAGESDTMVTWTSNSNLTCDPTTGDRFEVGRTTVTCTDDVDGTECTFEIIVVDNESPRFTVRCPPNGISQFTDLGQSTATVMHTVTAMDNVGVTNSDPLCTPPTGSSFMLGPTLVTCTARDAAVNTPATCMFMVTITDNEPPVFATCPSGPIRLAMEEVNSVQVTWVEPTATDNAGGAPVILSSHRSGDEFPPGTTTVTYNATDEAGNINTTGCWFNVDVVYQPPAQVITTLIGRNIPAWACLDVKWTKSRDETVSEYSISFWPASQEESQARRTVVTSAPTTYNSYHICSGLSRGELYTVKVETGGGDTRQLIATVNQWIRPDHPEGENVIPGTRSPSSVELSWEGVNLQNVEQYKVEIANPNVQGSIDYVTKTTNRFMVDSLDPRGHIVFVTAVVGSGPRRLESYRAVIFIPSVNLYPSDLLAYNYTESSIALWWIAGSTSDDKNPYMLYIRPEDAEDNYLTASAPPAVFTGLEPNREYQLTLISNLGLTLSTSQKTRPGRVSNIRPTEVLDESITLEWDPPTEGDIDSYEVYISPGESSKAMEVSGTSHTFSALTAETEYFFKIVSIFEDMKSVPQTLMLTAGVTEPAPAPPLNVIALVVGISLGLLAIILIIAIIVTCRTCRKLKADGQTGAGYESKIQLSKSQADTSSKVVGQASTSDQHSYVNSNVSRRLGDKLFGGAMGKKNTVPMLPVQRQKPDGSEYAVPDPLG